MQTTGGWEHAAETVCEQLDHRLVTIYQERNAAPTSTRHKKGLEGWRGGAKRCFRSQPV